MLVVRVRLPKAAQYAKSISTSQVAKRAPLQTSNRTQQQKDASAPKCSVCLHKPLFKNRKLIYDRNVFQELLSSLFILIRTFCGATVQ